jgi:deoxyribose-phosphate aldolase
MLNPASFIDHTLLEPTTTSRQIVLLCDEAVEYAFAAVCVPPCFVALAADQLYGTDVKVCSVVGFPCGYNSSYSKIQEADELFNLGADELDMVMALGPLTAGEDDSVRDEIAAVVQKAEGRIVKVIIECCYLSREQMQRATQLIVSAGAKYVKTSTGFGASGAQLNDVEELVRWSSGRIKVKASGGIRSYSEAKSFIDAGVSRLGCSASVRIMQEWMVAAN